MRRLFLVCLLVPTFVFTWSVVCAVDFFVIPVKKCCRCEGQLNGTRWCDNGDGTVTDMTTCLVWLKYADWGGQEPWRSNTFNDYYDAHRRATILCDNTIIHIGYFFSIKLLDGSVVGDWRLPTKTELLGLANEPEAVRTNTMRVFQGVKSTSYWTSTSDEGIPSYAWAVLMTTGTSSNHPKTTNYYVWPVRSGN